MLGRYPLASSPYPKTFRVMTSEGKSTESMWSLELSPAASVRQPSSCLFVHLRTGNWRYYRRNFPNATIIFAHHKTILCGLTRANTSMHCRCFRTSLAPVPAYGYRNSRLSICKNSPCSPLDIGLKIEGSDLAARRAKATKFSSINVQAAVI